MRQADCGKFLGLLMYPARSCRNTEISVSPTRESISSIKRRVGLSEPVDQHCNTGLRLLPETDSNSFSMQSKIQSLELKKIRAHSRSSLRIISIPSLTLPRAICAGSTLIYNALY